MDISYLPGELVEEVAKYLNFKDLCACSAVNAQWKNAFNNNRIWKKLCTYHPKYFDNQTSKLKYQPAIDFSQQCKAKEQAFKEGFVQENLSCGNFHVAKKEFGSCYINNLLDFVDNVGNHWLFIFCVEGMFYESRHFMQVWNMNDDPYLHASLNSPTGKLTRMFETEISMNNGKLLFTDHNIIMEFEFNYPFYELKLKHSVCINPPKGISENKHIGTKVVFVGNKVLGFWYTCSHIYRSLPPYCFVWNEGDSLEKEYTPLPIPFGNEDDLPHENFIFFEVKTNNSDKVVLVFLQFNRDSKSPYFNVRIFDTLLLGYTELFIEEYGSLHSFDISGSIVSLFYVCQETKTVRSKCYNTENSRVIFEEQFKSNGHNIFHQLVPSIGGELVVLVKNTIHVYEISLKIETNRFDVRRKNSSITILNQGIFLLQCIYKRRVIREVWNYKSGQKLYVLNFSPEFGMDKNFFSFRFIKNYCLPPTITAFKDPENAYSHTYKCSSVIFISFW